MGWHAVWFCADYVEMAVIPRGARNVRFEEAEEAANYIAIQSQVTGEYFLNGQYVIQWSGEYRAGVTLVYYRREDEQEEVFIPGPTLENLRFLVRGRTPRHPFKYLPPPPPWHHFFVVVFNWNIELFSCYSEASIPA